MEIFDVIDQLEDIMETSFTVPLIRKSLVDKTEIMELLGELRLRLPEDLKQAKKDRVFITHSGCNQETIDSVKEYLESLGQFEEILITRAGGVISSHCGPGTLGVLFIV